MKEIIVFTTPEEPLADMAVQLLREEGITAIKKGEVPRSVLPFTIDGLGIIEVRVPEDEVEPALEILAARFSDEGLEPSEEDTGGDNPAD